MPPTAFHAGAAPRRRSRPLARLLTVCAVLSTALLTPVAAGAAGSSNDDAYRNIGPATRADWMKNIASDTWLAAMSLPGTHDTLALHGGAAVQTQEDYGDSADTLTAQLERGIRAIDIRVRVTDGYYFAVHHGVVYQDANFDDVLTKAQTFLTQHPSETVVMRLKAECPYSNPSPTDCYNDGFNVTPDRMKKILADYVAKYPNLFYAPSVSGSARASVPRLSQVRGKLVLGSFDNVGDYSGKFGINTFNDHQEDHWAASTVPQKWDYVRSNIDQAVGDTTGEMYVTFTSASTGLNRLPFEYAGGYRSVQSGVTTDVPGVNYQLMQYLNGGGGKGHLGLVMMDFPGWALVDDIISRNDSGIVSGADRAIWLVNSDTDKTYVNTQYNRCMVRGPEFDSSKTGGLVTQHTCQATAPSSHQWGAEQPTSFDPKGYYWIKAANGKCLTVPYGDGTPPSAGTQLFWWGCEDRWFSGNQMWNIIPTKVGTAGGYKQAYKFVNNWTGQCLSMDPATASASGGKVTQDTCPK
ncbi:phosphatidylinositol-specific phospholipase C domain-containing protein [Streptomyces sp. NBC_00820]|uniref:phosphatidylinositol-specific phospholipase C domain-containing protein n=1 Tax=Streptomyces sp. NBC_00820 TaxID=2975842 RepID=UPI002ED05D9B|nr:phosphatidylinositol-specific phospholipase C domain-containing protein [Streptomyces sp. NBC_00820]